MGVESLGVDDWIVSVIKAMYVDATTSVMLNGRESRGFGVKSWSASRISA